MEYVNFGTTGLKVSRIALGLGLREQHDEAGAERLINRAVELGINLFDCANAYGLGDDRAHIGKSEQILGRVLKSRRDDVVITSKVASRIGPGPNDVGTSRYHIMREVERSLRRLDTDRIDVYLLHVPDPTTPMEEQLRALEDLVRAGKIRYVGVCNYQAWQVCQAIGIQDRLNASRLITVQNPYSLLNRDLEREMFPFVREFGVGVMAYSPLAIGLLSGVYRPGSGTSPETLWGRHLPDGLATLLNGPAGAVITAVSEIAERKNATVAQVALQWVLAQPEITVAITGADTAAQLDDNAGAVGLRLSAEEIERLNALSAGLQITGW